MGIMETESSFYIVSRFAGNGALDAYLKSKPDANRLKFVSLD